MACQHFGAPYCENDAYLELFCTRKSKCIILVSFTVVCSYRNSWGNVKDEDLKEVVCQHKSLNQWDTKTCIIPTGGDFWIHRRDLASIFLLLVVAKVDGLVLEGTVPSFANFQWIFSLLLGKGCRHGQH